MNRTPACLTVLLLSSLCACEVEDTRPAAWEYISPAIIEPNCATVSCHSQAAAVAGLDFSNSDRGYISLTKLWVWIVDKNGISDPSCMPLNGSYVCERRNRPMITPYNPAQSRVVHMLRAQGVERMPPDRTLPKADIELIERWILLGAPKTVVKDSPLATADAANVVTAKDAGAD